MCDDQTQPMLPQLAPSWRSLPLRGSRESAAAAAAAVAIPAIGIV